MKFTRIIVVLMFIISIIGFIDATYLTVSHYNGNELVCGSSGGCNIVTSSKYSVIFGIPVAGFGALYYLTMATLTFAWLQRKHKTLKQIISYLPITGFVMSVWFVYLQLVVIEAICFYCMGSALSSTLLFIGGMLLLFKKK